MANVTAFTGDAFQSNFNETKKYGKLINYSKESISTIFDLTDFDTNGLPSCSYIPMAAAEKRPIPSKLNKLVTCSQDNLLYVVQTAARNICRLIDTNTGETIVLRGHQKSINDLKFSTSDNSIVCTSSDVEVIIFKIHTDLKEAKVLTTINNPASLIIGHPQYPSIWLFARDNVLTLYQAGFDWKLPLEETLEHFQVNGTITGMQFTRDANNVIVLTSNNELHLFSFSISSNQHYVCTSTKQSIISEKSFDTTNVLIHSFLISNESLVLITSQKDSSLVQQNSIENQNEKDIESKLYIWNLNDLLSTNHPFVQSISIKLPFYKKLSVIDVLETSWNYHLDCIQLRNNDKFNYLVISHAYSSHVACLIHSNVSCIIQQVCFLNLRKSPIALALSLSSPFIHGKNSGRPLDNKIGSDDNRMTGGLNDENNELILEMYCFQEGDVKIELNQYKTACVSLRSIENEPVADSCFEGNNEFSIEGDRLTYQEIESNRFNEISKDMDILIDSYSKSCELHDGSRDISDAHECNASIKLPDQDNEGRIENHPEVSIDVQIDHSVNRPERRISGKLRSLLGIPESTCIETEDKLDNSIIRNDIDDKNTEVSNSSESKPDTYPEKESADFHTVSSKDMGLEQYNTDVEGDKFLSLLSKLKSSSPTSASVETEKAPIDTADVNSPLHSSINSTPSSENKSNETLVDTLSPTGDNLKSVPLSTDHTYSTTQTTAVKGSSVLSMIKSKQLTSSLVSGTGHNSILSSILPPSILSSTDRAQSNSLDLASTSVTSDDPRNLSFSDGIECQSTTKEGPLVISQAVPNVNLFDQISSKHYSSSSSPDSMTPFVPTLISVSDHSTSIPSTLTATTNSIPMSDFLQRLKSVSKSVTPSTSDPSFLTESDPKSVNATSSVLTSASGPKLVPSAIKKATKPTVVNTEVVRTTDRVGLDSSTVATSVLSDILKLSEKPTLNKEEGKELKSISQFSASLLNSTQKKETRKIKKVESVSSIVSDHNESVQALIPELIKAVVTSSSLQKIIQESIQENLKANFRDLFKANIIPSCEDGISAMFQQVNQSLKLSLEQYQQHFKSIQLQSDGNYANCKDLIEQILPAFQSSVTTLKTSLQSVQQDMKSLTQVVIEVNGRVQKLEESVQSLNSNGVVSKLLDPATLVSQGLISEAIESVLTSHYISDLTNLLSSLSSTQIMGKCTKLVQLCLVHRLTEDLVLNDPAEGWLQRMDWIKGLVMALISSLHPLLLTPKASRTVNKDSSAIVSPRTPSTVKEDIDAAVIKSGLSQLYDFLNQTLERLISEANGNNEDDQDAIVKTDSTVNDEVKENKRQEKLLLITSSNLVADIQLLMTAIGSKC